MMFSARFGKPATVVCFVAYPVFPMPCALLPSFALPTRRTLFTACLTRAHHIRFCRLLTSGMGHSVKQEIEVSTLKAREVSCTVACCTPNKHYTNYFNQRLSASLVSHMFWNQNLPMNERVYQFGSIPGIPNQWDPNHQ